MQISGKRLNLKVAGSNQICGSVTVSTCVALSAIAIAWSIWAGQTLTLLALSCGALTLVAFWSHPKLSYVVWLLSLTMVPIWISIDLAANVPAHCIVALLAIAATLPRTNLTFTKYDAYFLVFLFLSFAAVLIGGSTSASWAQILLRWGIPYLAARVLVSAVGVRFAVNAIAIILGVVGGLAVLELVLSWHPFSGLSTASLEYEIWNTIQVRSGIDRSEWAFGHSIALGGSLAMSIPFILRSSLGNALKLVLFVMVLLGIISTASRGALIAAAFTAAICLLYLARNRVARTAGLLVMTVAALLAVSAVDTLLQGWARGSTDEEQSSFEYRNYLYSTFLPEIEWFGRSPIYVAGATRNQSTDSAILQLGLSFGWVVLIGALLPLALGVVRVVVGRASTPEIAIVGQIPLFTTVALITQYESLIFVVAGTAVQMLIDKKTGGEQIKLNSNTEPHARGLSRRQGSQACSTLSRL